MFENFKSDIIYYNTNADFELEFNLCGCYRKMRLLHDKCSDKKTLLLSLSRAVSRSRIIIITAPLFSDERIINTVAAAIGSSVEIIDNAAYNINSDIEIEVIKDSVPLVTSDGFFGGCIIESGPQTLILLTDNKNVRKTIMNDLIHPYVEEFAGVQKEANDEEQAPEQPQEPEEAEEIITETEEESEDELYETEDQELIIDTEPEENEDGYGTPEVIDLYTEPETENPTELEEDDTDDYDTDFGYGADYFTEEEDEEETSPLSIWLLIISVILLLAIAVLCFCIFYVPTKAGIEPAAYLKDVFDTMFK